MKYAASLFEWKGLVLLLATFIFCTFIFYSYSADVYYSSVGAFFAALLVWLSYLVIRLFILASLRNDE